MHPEFGEGIDIIGPLRDLLKRLPKLPAGDARLVLLETYETTFGIYNHNVEDPERPMANVAMHYAENVAEGDLLDERIDQFADKQVAKHFGLSLREFLDFPPDICFKILEKAAKLKAAGDSAAENVLNQLEAARKNP